MERLVSSMNSTRTYGTHRVGGAGRDGKECETATDKHCGVDSRPGFEGRVGAGPEIPKKRTDDGWQAGLGKEKSRKGQRRSEQSSGAPEAATKGDNYSSGHVGIGSTLGKMWSQGGR
ncbi:hypothetical protein PAL_GLEAN10002102 [Pteropus alecto]|uniref:Uncharacterized protein n=1 Tax=Pteropus alecto TaxID=9402 RepID=L5KC46_PTEAL|nr:hypothetical protein PAL_GLEAN10002102 [Pteropus alecto]